MSFARLVLLLATVVTAAGLAPFSAAQTVDTTPPTLDRGKIDGGTMTLYFSEALDPNSVGGSFWANVQVQPNGQMVAFPVRWDDVSINGNVVTLGLGGTGTKAGLPRNHAWYTAPTDPTSSRLQDLAGNALRTPARHGLRWGTGFLFLDNVTGVETTPPTVSAATVDSATLTLVFNETLGAAASLATGAFTVKKTPSGGSEQNVSLTGSPDISGATVTLTLASEVLKTDTDVKVSYTNPTSGTGNRLVDAVGNEAVSFSDKAVANETGAPVLTTLALDADDGRRLTLTFDQGLAVPSAEQVRRLRYAISILGARHQGAALDELYPNTIAVSGPTVTLTFGAEVLPGHTATVTYNPLAARDAALADLHGNKVAGFANRAVTRPAGGGAVAPSLAAARMAGTGLTLTFDRALDAGSAPAGRRFEVWHQMRVAGGLGPQLVARGTGTASVSGQTVSVTLDSAVPEDAHAWVYYRKGDDASPLRGASNGPEAVDIWGYGGVSDRTAPALTRAVVAGTKLVLYYGEALNTGSTPAAGDYTVTAGTTAQTVSTVSMSTGAVTLTLGASVAASAAVTVDYTAGTNPVQDVAGNNAGNLSGETATNLGPTNTTAPELAATGAAVLADRTLTLAWTLPLDPARVPDKSAFTVNGSGFEVVDSVVVRDRKVELGLRWGAFPCSTAPTVSYETSKAGTNQALRSVWGVDAAGFAGQSVRVAGADRCVDGFTGASMDGMQARLAFDRPLSPSAPPRAEDFQVAGDGSGESAGSARSARTARSTAPLAVEDAGLSADDREVVLTLSRAAADGERLTVRYVPPPSGGGLWDAEGNQMAAFTGQVAVGDAAATGVAVVSDPGDDATYVAGEKVQVQLTFDKAVDVDTANGTPRLKLGLIDGDDAGDRWAAYEDGSGTKTLTFAWAAAAPDEAAAGVAVLADTLELNGGTIRLAGTQTGAALGHAGLAHDPEHKVDAAPPRLVRGEIDGATMTLHFSEALDEGAAEGRFRVTVQTSGTSSTGFFATGDVAVDGETVTVGLGAGNPQARAGLSGRNHVTYFRRADGSDAALRDLAGNPLPTPRTPLGYGGEWRSSAPVALENVTGGAPAVTGIAVVSDAGSDATYGDGDRIRVEVTFSKAVDVTGTPRLAIDMDPARWGKKWAAYERGTGSNSLTFVHTVGEPNLSTQGIAVLANTLELGGGTIRSGGAAAVLAHDGLGHDANHKVDWRTAPEESGGEDPGEAVGDSGPPSVTGVSVVSSPASGDTYLLGEKISIRVSFGEAVSVTGAPKLSIDMDPAAWGTKQAVFESGGGTNTLTFVHTVVEPNYSTQGIAVLANTLALNGGTIRSTTGANAALGHTGLGHDSGHKVDWRPEISVADARANEGAGASVAFEVSLDRAFTGSGHSVTVDYATSDGSAKAGEDYTATSGTLTFAAGERTKTVNVPVLDDAVDEGEETFAFRLSNATGARIGDGEATGTIANDDPLQKMWLSRFGRTVADHVTTAVSDRLATPLTGAQVTVGGQRVDLAAVAEDEARVGEALTAVARALGASENREPGDGFGSSSGAGGWPATGLGGIQTAAPGSTPAREVTGRELLLGSAFHLAAEGDGTGPGLAAWGRVTVGGFDGEAPADGGSVRIDGEVTTGILGADAEWNRLLAGVAISVSEGEGTFAQTGVDKGTIESSLTTVSPYARLAVTDRVSVWGLAGWGTGDMTIVQAANDRGQPKRVRRTDIEMRLIAGGGRGALLEADETGGIDLALKADGFYVETEAEAVSNEGSTTGTASRVRLALEGSRAFEVGGGTLTPGLEAGLRHDGGDAETGTGVELGGRVSWTDPGTGLSMEARVRTLVAHEDSDYREWGASGSVRLAPGERGRGLSFSLAPTYGAASSGVGRLWSARDAQGLAPGGEFEAERRLEGELGYGMSVFGDRFTGTPNLGFGVSDRARDYRIGWRLTSAIEGDPGFEVNLDAMRRESANDNGADVPVDHGVMLRAAIRW